MHRREWRPCLLLLALIFALPASGPISAQDELVQHLVLPGDTWMALSWRYGVPEEALRQAHSRLNRQQQPAIGRTIAIPGSKSPERMGVLVNSDNGGVIQLSASAGTSPWRAALANGLEHPYRPLLYRPLFIPGGSGPPRQLPPGVQALDISQAPAQPGQALAIRGLLEHEMPLAARFAGQEMHVAGNGNNFTGLVGTGAFFEPGQYTLEIQAAGQPPWSQPWLMIPGQWTFEEITYTGAAATISAESIRQERERLMVLWNQFGDRPFWTAEFQEPLHEYLAISSYYGARRSYGGSPYDRYHEGLDFSAYGGTDVHAPAAGVVVLAETLVARGGAVIIDHGPGVFSGFYHLSEVLVEPGRSVQPGEVVGRVGSTGLSTGNHLHWDFLVAGTWVDPAAWLGQGMGCWLLAGWGTPCREG